VTREGGASGRPGGERANTVQRWETTGQVAAALQRFQDGLPGWQPPAAYGVGRLGPDGRTEFARVDDGSHALPGVVLATVCQHHGGSASYQLGAADLARAIDLLAPAEACLAYDHPNLLAWRGLHGQLSEGDTVLAVFAAELDGPSVDPHVIALRAQARPR
jgi:hypothetical protein